LKDPDDLLGLANFTAMMLTRGTQKRSFQEIHNALESSGANLGFSAGIHSCRFSGRCLVEDLPLLLDILSDCLRTPNFEPGQVEKLRSQLLTGLAMRGQDTREMASLTFNKILFEEHPYSRPEDGYVDTIRAITQQDMKVFHESGYGPKGLVLSIVGAVDPEETNKQVNQILGDWENKDQTAQPVLPAHTPLAKTIVIKTEIAGKYQSDLIVGTIGPRRKDPDHMPASLGNSILGQFGMMGRIGDVVREKSGLAYYAYSTLHSGFGPGAWVVSAGVNPANIQKAIDLIKEEISRIVSNGVSKEELADSQNNFIGRLPLSLESNAGVCGALLNIERYSLGLDYYQLYRTNVQKVTIEDVHRIVKKYLDPEVLAIAIAGP
ncbi:M16 family metallopeptidase, partial [Chloroflexota bacterium]